MDRIKASFNLKLLILKLRAMLIQITEDFNDKALQ